jgi:GTP cyclohydrolase IA
LKSKKLKTELSLEDLVHDLLVHVKEDPDREGLVKTPARVAKSLHYLTKGYSENIKTIVNDALFTEKYKEMVIVKDIDFVSMCEHHLLPFYGKAHVAYIPNGKIIGLSKIPRIVDMFARRLQVQERMTRQIADTLMDILKPDGVAVVVEGRHMCMMIRGVEKQHSTATTSTMLGVFQENMKTRSEFLTLITNKLG